MSLQNNLMINFDGQTLFKVLAGGSFTVPTTVSAPSPIGISSGVSPTTIFDTKRNVAGGMIIAAFDNQADTTQQNFQMHLNPGDVVAVSAVAANVATVTVNGKTVFTIANAAITIAGVIGFYG